MQFSVMEKIDILVTSIESKENSIFWGDIDWLLLFDRFNDFNLIIDTKIKVNILCGTCIELIILTEYTYNKVNRLYHKHVKKDVEKINKNRKYW